MNLVMQVLIATIADAAKAKGVQNFRIAHKRNAKGELMVALIIVDRDGAFGRIGLGE